MKFGTASTLWFLAALTAGRVNAGNYSPPKIADCLGQCETNDWTTSLIAVTEAGDDWVYQYEIGSGSRNQELKEWSISFPEACGVRDTGDCEHRSDGFKDDNNKCNVFDGFPMVRRCKTDSWDKKKDKDIITIYVPKSNVLDTTGGEVKVHLWEKNGAKDANCPKCNIAGPRCGTPPQTQDQQTTNLQDASSSGSDTCNVNDFKNECTSTNGCKQMYPTAFDCKNSEGGICYCGDGNPGTVCGCLPSSGSSSGTNSDSSSNTEGSKTMKAGQATSIEMYRASRTDRPVLSTATMTIGGYCGQFCVDVNLTDKSDFIKHQSDDEHFVKFDGMVMANAGSEGFKFKTDENGVIVGWHVCFHAPNPKSSYDLKIHTLAHEIAQGEVQTSGSPGQSIPLSVDCAGLTSGGGGGSSSTTTTSTSTSTTTSDEDPCAKDPEPPCNNFAICDTIMANENGSGRDYYTIYDSAGKTMCVRGRDAKALLESNQGYQCTPPAGVEVDVDEPVVECAHDPEPSCDSKVVCDRIGQRTYFMVWSDTGEEACVSGRDAKHLVETQGYSCIEVVAEEPENTPPPPRPNGGYPVEQDEDDVCERCSKKPKFLTFEYTGLDDVFYHHQTGDRASVTGSVGVAETVTIDCYKDGDTSQSFFSGSVSKGGKFLVENPGKSDINEKVQMKIKGPDGSVLQTINFNAKCDSDAALVQGDQFGSIKLVSSRDQEDCGFGTLPPAENGGLLSVEEGKVDMCGKATGACDEKPKALKFLYTGIDASLHHQPTKASIEGSVNGAGTVYVKVFYDQDVTLYTGMVAIDGTFVVTRSGNDRIDRLLTVQIKSTAGELLQTIVVDSKCEEPLVEDDQFGSIKLVAFVDKDSCGFGTADVLVGDNNDYDPSVVMQGVEDGKNMCDLCPKMPNKLQFQFMGVDQTSHHQGSRASVTGIIDGKEMVQVLVFKPGDENELDKRWFSGMVSTGEKFTVVGNGKQFPDDNMVVQLKEIDGDAVYQTIQLYTNCDKEDTQFIIGDQFGSIKLVGYEDLNGCGIGDFVDIQTKSLNTGVDTCHECGKPMKLKFMYTAEDISNHNQGEEKAFVNGVVNAAPQVQIVVGNAANGIWYAGTHLANETFVVDSHYSEFTHKNMIIQVKDTAGTVLQTVQINVKCEAPIVEGDRFGSIKMIGYVDDGGCGFGDTVAVPSASTSTTLNDGNDMCTQCEKPMKLMFEYTGDYVVNHNQGLTKAFVLGTVNGLSPIHLTVSDDKGITWYRANHDIGDIIALDADDDKFPSKSMIMRLSDPADPTMEPLQTLAIHTSCEAPLVENDEFGSIKLVGSRDKGDCGFGSFPTDTTVIEKEKSKKSPKSIKTKKDMLSDTKGEVVFDLKDYKAGDKLYILDQCVNIVAMKRIIKNGPLVPGTAMVFNSSAPTGGDTDLGTPNADFGGPGVGLAGKRGQPFENSQSLGNILIISEDDNAEIPDDNQFGGRFIINFCRPMDVKEIGLLDNEDPTEFKARLADGNIAVDVRGHGGDNSYEAAVLSFSGVMQLNVTLGGSGAITDIKVKPAQGSKATKEKEAKEELEQKELQDGGGSKKPVDRTTRSGNKAESPENCVNWRDCNQGKCMEDNWFRYRNGGHLVCTAKEVTLSHIETPRMSCEENTMVTIDMKATVHFNTGRYDVGWYIAKDGGDALNGDCYIQPLLKNDKELSHDIVAAPGSKEVVGAITWDNDHKKPDDMCGDVHMETGGGGVIDYTNIGMGMELPCVDKTQTGYMDFAICFSWRQPGGDSECMPKELYPGTPSKCFCTRYDIPQITVIKAEGPVECE